MAKWRTLFIGLLVLIPIIITTLVGTSFALLLLGIENSVARQLLASLSILGMLLACPGQTSTCDAICCIMEETGTLKPVADTYVNCISCGSPSCVGAENVDGWCE